MIRFRSFLGAVLCCALGAALAGIYPASTGQGSPYAPALLDLVASQALARQLCIHATCQQGSEPHEPATCLRADGETNTRCKLTGNGCKTKPC